MKKLNFNWNDFFGSKVIFMGFLHLLVAFSAITSLTTIVGFNMPLAFLFAGIGTLVFHIATKNKLPVTIGVSAVYVGSIIYVSETFGKAYAHGGIIVAGFIYLIFSFIMFKWQDKILKFFPMWLLSTAVLMIGISLIPIGTSLMSNSMFVGLTALIVTALTSLIGGRKVGVLAMPLGIISGVIVALITGVMDFSNVSDGMVYTKPAFNWESSIIIGLIALPVMFEMMGDTKNTGDIIGIDVFKEVGLGRISLGNGLASILGGIGGSNAYTTYSENAGFLLLSRYFNPNAQIWTAIFFIVMAFFKPIMNFVSAIPLAVFGGVVTYLFAMIAVNAIKQIMNSVDLNKDAREFTIITIMLSVFFIPIVIGSISISSVALATMIGTVLNSIFIIKDVKSVKS